MFPTRLLSTLLVAFSAAVMLLLQVPAAQADTFAFDYRKVDMHGRLDGKFGGYTLDAVRRFQRSKKLDVDGVAGPQTLAALGLGRNVAPEASLRAGMAGPRTLELQKRLAQLGFWTPQVAKKPAKPVVAKKPTSKVAQAPRPAAPVWNEPAPPAEVEPAIEPIKMTAEPAPVPQVADKLAAKVTLRHEDTVLRVGTWMTPALAGTNDFDFSFTRPTWTVDAMSWWQNWGLTTSLTAFNQTLAAFRTEPFFPATTLMGDAMVAFRPTGWPAYLKAGYRGLSGENLHFASVGAAYEQVVFGDWLALVGRAQTGTNFGPATYLDGQAGLAVRMGGSSLEAGFRHMTLQSARPGEAMFSLSGPTANFYIGF